VYGRERHCCDLIAPEDAIKDLLTMKISTAALLGAAAVICAAAPLYAQTAPAKPAVADKAAAKPAAAPDADAPPTADTPAAPATAPVAAAAPAKPGDEDFTPAVQEATNHDEDGVKKIDAAPQTNPDDADSIAATVNDESISDFEIRQRMALYIATSGLQPNEEQKKRIRVQILEQLESEKVQLQEAVKKKITVSPVEVDKQINRMMSDNHFTIEQLRTTLNNAGASEDALRAQITASIAWQKTVQDEYGERVNVTPEQVDAEMARYAEGANKPHFRVMEIFVPVENPEQDGKVKKDMADIEAQLHQGAPFPMVARQFSQHPTAATGGDIGWIHEGQLAPELNEALSQMQTGGISSPIRSTGGYYILAVRERQEPLGTKFAEAPKGPTGPAGTLPLARLLLPMPPKPTKQMLDNVMKVAGEIKARVTECDQFEKIQKQLPGSVYMNLGTMKLAELSPQIQGALAQTTPGEIANPFMSEAGVEIIARCDKRVAVQTAYVMPTRQEVENQLFEQQISALARRYIRDLKRNANIQVRDDSKPDALIR
jgi:peptidyl-prolyl cis-trans isomerase SurA